MTERDPGIAWLLKSNDPSVRYFTIVELLDEHGDSRRAKALRAKIRTGPRVRRLLSGQRADGGFGVHPYQKWTGAHWRLVSLVELGVSGQNNEARAAANHVLKWLGGRQHLSGIVKINGLTRRCASQEGNALAVCSRLGMAGEPRVAQLATSLVSWQWPDGGWNCDKNPKADHSSFYESLAPLWGLIEYYWATDDINAREAAERTANLFLEHRLFKSDTTNEVIDPEWLKLHFPLYWHYDVLQALRILSRFGRLEDPRTADALDLVERKRGADGLWRPEGYYWYPPGRRKSNVEIVDWGRGGPNEMITLNALRVLKAAGRLDSLWGIS